MAEGWWFLAGLIAGGSVGAALTVLLARRIWRNARRLAARSKGRESLLELGHLAGGLAHEIKNPLSTINLNLKLLSEDLARHDDEEHRRWLRRLTNVREEADRLRGILDDFLRYAGKIELSPAATDLRTVISELVDFFLPQAEVAHVLVRTSLPDKAVPCNLDERLFKQALLNLMINAVQAMSAGGELLLKVAQSRDEATVEVIDTGPGISAEHLAKVFQAYFSTKQGGSGLGLPFTRRVVHEHQGTISVESEPGKGTRFLIALPLAGNTQK